MQVKNIIFDLGGVILNVDYDLSVKKFEELGLADFQELYAQSGQSKLFDDLEIGAIKGDEFIKKIKTKINRQVADEKIKAAWNAMILDYPIERLALLKRLKSKYNTFLLSNTNEIHEQYFIDILSSTTSENSLDPYFHKVYFSHKIGLRKPHPEVFNYILQENNLIAEETLFIDDSFQHIEAAKKLGINAVLLRKGQTIESDLGL